MPGAARIGPKRSPDVRSWAVMQRQRTHQRRCPASSKFRLLCVVLPCLVLEDISRARGEGLRPRCTASRALVVVLVAARLWRSLFVLEAPTLKL